MADQTPDPRRTLILQDDEHLRAAIAVAIGTAKAIESPSNGDTADIVLDELRLLRRRGVLAVPDDEATYTAVRDALDCYQYAYQYAMITHAGCVSTESMDMPTPWEQFERTRWLRSNQTVGSTDAVLATLRTLAGAE